MTLQPARPTFSHSLTLACWLLSASCAAALVSAACKPLMEECHSCAGTPGSMPALADAQAWRNVVPDPGRPGHLAYPIHEDGALPNGLRVLSLDRSSGVVTLSLVVKLPPAKIESSRHNAFLARMLTEGTTKLPGLAFAEAVEDLGTQIHSGANRDSAYLSITVLPDDTEAAMSLLFDAAKDPEFSGEALERVRAEWLAGLKSRCDEPAQLAAMIGLRALWGDVHGAPVQGTPASVRGVSSSALAALHVEQFVPANSALIAVGNIDRESIMKMAGAASAGWKAHTPAPSVVPPPLYPPANAEVLVVERRGTVQTSLFVAQRLPPRNTPGHEARLLLNTALGGLFTSRINQNLREEHAFTYGAFSSVISTRFVGAWSAMTSVEAQHTAAALLELLREHAALGGGANPKPLSAIEVDRSRAALVARVGAHLQSVDQIADDLGELFVYDLNREYYGAFEKLLARIDLATVNAVGKEWFRQRPPIIVAVGDGAMFGPALEEAGFSTKLADTSWLELAE